jgi:hypothetical protein
MSEETPGVRGHSTLLAGAPAVRRETEVPATIRRIAILAPMRIELRPLVAPLGPDGSPNLLALARFVLTQPRRIPQLVRLGHGARAATRAAAGAALAALSSVGSRVPGDAMISPVG